MEKLKEIIICIGIPGSGKSTFAKKWVAEDPENRMRFNGEDILNSMTSNIYVKDIYGYIKYELCENMVKYAIENNKSIVLDNTHIDIDYFIYVYHMIYNLIYSKIDEYCMIIKDFTGIDSEICIERDSKRIKPVGRKEIEKCYLSKISEFKKYLNEFKTFDFGILNIKFEKV